MATLLPARAASFPCTAPPATAELVLLTTPVRAADGHLRTHRLAIPAPAVVADVLPAGIVPEKCLLNGKVLAPEAYADTILSPGDELWLLPQWGIIGGLIGVILAGLIVSVATTALSYVLFPPDKPRMQSPETPTTSFEGISTTIGPGAVVPVIYGRYRVGGQLLHASVDQAQTVVDVGQQPRTVTALAAAPTLTLLLAIGEGAMRDVIVDSLEINGQPIQNFPTVQVDWRAGTPDQTPMLAFGESANTFADGRAIPRDGVGITYTSTAPIEAFILNVVFHEGLYHFTREGNKEDNVVVLRYWYRLAPGGGWAGPLDWHVTASRTAPVRLGIRREGVGLALYDLRIEYVFVKNDDETKDRWQPTLESVTEIQHNVQSYPDTALVGLRTVATDSLQGALPNITVEVRGRLVRQGTFATNAQEWTDNPAWCVMDFLTNARYGLAISDSEIDLPGFAAWAAYCDQIIDGERRHTLNYVIDHDIRAQSVLLEMLGGNRTILFKSEGLWTPRPTRNEPPVQLLNWANCTDLKLTYTRDVDRVNVLEARFGNESEHFEQDVLTWPTIDHWPAEVRKAGMEIRGVTKATRVMRALQFELNRRRFETQALEMTCALDAIVLQPHDLFRFAHPLPGWGVSGRLQAGSTTTSLLLDEGVQFVGLQDYIVYVRHDNDVTELRHVAYSGDGSFTHINLGSPLSQTPTPRQSLWAFGVLLTSQFDTATRIFRVTNMKRTNNGRVLIQAIIQNPSIYDEADGEPLPITTGLFNPLGPPPALTSLIAREVTRIQASGASMRVCNLSWDVAPLTRGLAPYGGATILRRTVLDSALGGQVVAGTNDFGVELGVNDPGGNFLPITQVSGHVLDFDDFTILSGLTYVYRVIPVSRRGVPNSVGFRDVRIHIAGPTTPDFFPSTPLNLRLKGQPVGAVIFEGPDIHIQWDAPTDASLFSETFFIADFVVQMWMPAQQAFLRQAIVAAGARGVPLNFAYTREMNAEDHVQAGLGGAQRAILIQVWCRTNTGRISLDPAQMTVFNPPPDMSTIQPTVTALFEAALIDWTQFVEPRDFAGYQIYLDTQNPPVALYLGVDAPFKKITPVALTPNITYYTYILPFDTFGPGAPTPIVSFVPAALDGSLDTTPPAVPTGLALTTGSGLSNDGTVMSWVQATWTPNTEGDLAGYKVHFRVHPSVVPTTFAVDKSQHAVRLENPPGGVLIFVKLLAYDRLDNASAFTAEVSITTLGDTVAPFAPTNLNAFGSIRAVQLLWTPPPDLDYAGAQVWTATTNNLALASYVGIGYSSFTLEGMGPNETRWFWLRAVDTSGNVSANFHPAAANAGVPGTAGQLDTTFISSLAANKIITGTLQVLVGLDIGGRMYLDAPNGYIVMFDNQATPAVRVLLGKLGALSTQYGLQLFNDLGQLMWNFATGATQDGISDNAITAAKITAGVINAGHLRADTAVITTAIQIATAIINDAHIQFLSASKLIAGTIQANIGLGVGNRVFLRGGTGDVLVLDTPGNPRVLLGSLESLGIGDYGLVIWNAAGQVMWNFSGGATSEGVMPNAIRDLHVTNLSASKLIAGTIFANISVGVGNRLFLRGISGDLLVMDAATTPRVLLGSLESVGIGDYGLLIWNAAGQLMWDFTSGATTSGIVPNAVTEAVVFNAGASALGTDDTEIEVCNVTFPTLRVGDQALIWFTALAQMTDPTHGILVNLREDTATGTIVHQMSFGFGALEGPIVLQHAYTAGITQTNKAFRVTFKARNPGYDVFLNQVRQLGMRRQR